MNAEGYEVELKVKDNDKILFLEKFLGRKIFMGDSLIYISSDSFRLTDSVTVYANILYGIDENKYNNYYSITIKPGVERGTIVINEFLANPDSCAEWIELFNNSDRSYSISNWFVSDMLLTPKPVRIENDAIINADEYLIITSNISRYNKRGNEKNLTN